MADNKIDLNSADDRILTQLPGISIDIARNIVNHRHRRGIFTAWDELRAVSHFPVARLDEIKKRAELKLPEGVTPPRHLNEQKIEEFAKAQRGYTRSIRTTRRQDKLRAS